MIYPNFSCRWYLCNKAGLFSAAVAACIVESYESLHPDSGDISVVLLWKPLPPTQHLWEIFGLLTSDNTAPRNIFHSFQHGPNKLIPVSQANSQLDNTFGWNNFPSVVTWASTLQQFTLATAIPRYLLHANWSAGKVVRSADIWNLTLPTQSSSRSLLRRRGTTTLVTFSYLVILKIATFTTITRISR